MILSYSNSIVKYFIIFGLSLINLFYLVELGRIFLEIAIFKYEKIVKFMIIRLNKYINYTKKCFKVENSIKL